MSEGRREGGKRFRDVYAKNEGQVRVLELYTSHDGHVVIM